ncbi:MAG: DMT family transporter [Xanthobacteraceae bacterium]|nr:DMT family transporter [Xanthobacteraceae bacterium]MBX3535314.1 DMT family transporter [Xanthobacteraceae bacterium]MCW5674107.1 DMT family transporter [Xanthobacteraceae bacterium]MCW5678082.1 DMT family transporter [Xanthobacteraceae bacterium]
MKQHDRLDIFATLAMVALTASWGFQQVAIKVTNNAVSPAFQSGLRCAGAFLLLLFWCYLRGIKLFERDGTLVPGLVVGFLFASEFAFIYWALVYTDVARSILFLYASPFVVAIGAHFLLPNERMGIAQVLGLLCAFGGLVLAVRDGLSLPSKTALIGDMMMLVAAVLWAVTTLIIKKTTLAKIHPAKTLAYQLGFTALFVPGALLVGETGITHFDGLVAASLAYQIVIVAFASYLAWFALVRTYPASTLSVFTFLSPLFAMLSGAYFLNEQVGPILWIALVLVAFGIWLVNRPRSRASAAA